MWGAQPGAWAGIFASFALSAPISLSPVLIEGVQFTKAAVGISLPNIRNNLGLPIAGKSFSREIWVLLKVQVLD